MTKLEFINRTLVEVSEKEFDAINEVYMNSELDKDEFCKMWMKMNKTRVKNAKANIMLKKREEAYRDALHKFYHKFDTWEPRITNCVLIWEVKISTYEIQALSYAGICVAGEDGKLKYLSDVCFEIGKYLGMF